MSYSRNRVIQAVKAFFFQTKNLTKDKVTYIGEDHMGNKYFEAERPNNARRFQRYFERKTQNDILEVVDLTKVPPAWDAWLRFRRRAPPSEEEVRESEEYFQNNQAMALEKRAKVIATDENERPSSGDMRPHEKEREARELNSRGFPKLPLE